MLKEEEEKQRYSGPQSVEVKVRRESGQGQK